MIVILPVAVLTKAVVVHENASPSVCRLALLLTMEPVSTKEFPLRTKAPAVASKVILLNVVPAVNRLVTFSPVVPAKTRESPLTGAVPPQLAALVVAPFPAPPVQTQILAPLASIGSWVHSIRTASFISADIDFRGLEIVMFLF